MFLFRNLRFKNYAICVYDLPTMSEKSQTCLKNKI